MKTQLFKSKIAQACVVSALLIGANTIIAADSVSTNSTATVAPASTNAVASTTSSSHQPKAMSTTREPAQLVQPSKSPSGKRVEISGALAKPAKEKGFRAGLRRFGNLFNPFAPVDKTEKKEAPSDAWVATLERERTQSILADDKGVGRPEINLLSVSCPDVPK